MTYEESNSYLDMTKQGIDLCLKITQSHLTKQTNGLDQLALGLIALKVCDHLSGSLLLLQDDHLESALALMRVTLDSIGMLGLATRDTQALETWMFLTSIDRNKFPMAAQPSYDKLVTRLEGKARRDYDRLLSKVDEPGPVTDLVHEYNTHIHLSWESLSHACGLAPVAEGTFGLEASQAMTEAEGDPELAVKKFQELRKNMNRLDKWVKEKQTVETLVVDDSLADSDSLSEAILTLLCATHHLFDITSHKFGYPVTATAEEFANWHKESLQLMRSQS